MNQEKINFHIARDFSELFNIVTKFLSQNFLHFFKMLLFIAGPFILISSIFGALYQSHALQLVKSSAGTDPLSIYNNMLSQLGWEYFAFLFFAFCSGIVLITTVYSYVIAYDTYGSKNFEVQDIRMLMQQNMWKTIKGFFTLSLILIGILVTIAGIAAIFISQFKVVGIVLLILIFLVLFIVSPPFIWQFSTFYLPIMTEDVSVSEALRKTRMLLRGDFFSTWILIIASGLLLAVLGVVFSIPQAVYHSILQFGGGNINSNNIPFIIVTTVCTFGSTFIYSIFYIVCAFQYYSLSEKKEGKALMNRIDEIGNAPSDDVEQQY